jgi:hypothetical protein
MEDGNTRSHFRLNFLSKKPHPSGRIQANLEIDDSGLGLHASGSGADVIDNEVQWLDNPAFLYRLAVFHINISMWRRFYPLVTILTNANDFESNPLSHQVNYVRLPFTYQLWDYFSNTDETPSFLIDGRTFDPFCLGEEIAVKHLTSEGVPITHILLLSSKEVDPNEFKRVFIDVKDFDGAMDALLSFYPVIVFSEGFPDLCVMTKDPDIVSMLESLPHGEEEADLADL